MRLIGTIVGVLFLLNTEAIHAQTAPQATPPPLAPGPLLSRAPAYSQWLVSITTGSGNSVALPDAQTKYAERTLVTKTGDIRYEITVKADGEKFEKWAEGSMQATVTPGQSNPMLALGGATARGNGGYTDYSKTDFPGFEWIRRKDYTGVQSVEGVPCIVFHSDEGEAAPTVAAAPSAGGAAAALSIPQGGNTAYISDQGRLPVLLIVGTTVTLYQFRTAPTAPLPVPPNVQGAFSQEEARLRQISAGPGAP